MHKGGYFQERYIPLFIVLKANKHSIVKKTYPFYSEINIFCNLAA